MLTQKTFLIFLIFFLTFMYYEFSIIKMNVFINLFLAIIIMLTKLTCLRKFFISNISRNGTFLHSIIKAFIIFQSFRTIVLLYASGISVFTNSVCVLQYQGLLSSIFRRRKSKKNFKINILLKCE